VTSFLGVADPEAVALAARALGKGSVVAIPTDTVYGLAVDPWRAGAVERLFALKQRPREVSLPILVGTRDQVAVVAGRLAGAAAILADRYWPGPLTMVVPRADGFTVDLGGPPSARGTVGVRWPDHPVVQQLCREHGPLAVTSANRHGSSPATTADQVGRAFPGPVSVSVIVDGGVCRGVPSTVVECRESGIRCLREGAIEWREITDSSPGGTGWSPPA
jgi:tRNA threonylcarbamoyl adenosine modification protein (Sua5/YciO/YrdC/YwlC family)